MVIIWVKRVLFCALIVIPYKLLENAVLGWGDNLIGNYLGLSSPTVSQVARFLWLWGVPFVLAAATLYGGYHLWWIHTQTEGRVKKKSTAETLYPRQVWISKSFAKLFPPTMMPMSEAVRYLSDALRGTGMERFARRNFGDEVDRLLTIFAGWICKTSIPVFGKIPASIEFREFDKNRLGQGRFRSGVSEFWLHGERAPAYTDISIKQRHLNRAIEEVKGWEDKFPEDGSV